MNRSTSFPFFQPVSFFNSKSIKLFVIAFLLNGSLSGQTVVTFLNPLPAAPTMCSDTWTENGIPQSFNAGCSFDYSGGDLWLFPATVRLDLSGLGNIDSVKIDFIDWCGMGCTMAEFLFNGNVKGSVSNATSNVPETMWYINSNNIPIDEMAISSSEGQLFEITIYHSPVCNAVPDIHTESGDVYVEDFCHGVILKSPNGSCFRIRVNDNGTLFTEAITCP